MSDESSGHETGPFCRHWDDPSECAERCGACGHTCAEHGSVDCPDTACTHDGCACGTWVDAP